ncbi:hypothetical protein PCASD_11114 [Puccinia coronata f. sp. avenae]|uniref:Uncharacterized protein n=1 Tax=Puccinia coronata f. sp. avenae TaxID=200324 RepID=A0A2N5TB57_9BASI|nr:hypothetical protein PCASD_11114 [Puccinia coronata f. sp. avenae]
MGIRWPQFWLFLFGLLGVIDKSTTFLTSFDGTWNEAINRTKLLVDTRRAAEEILKGRKSPPSWEDVMKTSKKIAGNRGVHDKNYRFSLPLNFFLARHYSHKITLKF